MGIFSFLKKKSSTKVIHATADNIEEYMRERLDENSSLEDIEEVVSDVVEAAVAGMWSSDQKVMTTLPTPGGVFHEEGIDEFWDKSNLIEMSRDEDDSDGQKYFQNLHQSEKEGYYTGKALYESKYGKIVGTSLAEVIRNVSQFHNMEFYENDDYNFRVWEALTRVGNLNEFWLLDYNGDPKAPGGVRKEGFRSNFRRIKCLSIDIISEEDLMEYHMNYSSEFHPLSEKETRLVGVNEIKRRILNDVCLPLKEKNFDSNTKTWTDFDLSNSFEAVREMMIDTKNPFPDYVWNIVSGNPFDRIYRIGRDYMKWKGEIETSKLLFSTICQWENGELLGIQELGEYEVGLWINWNKVSKDFISMKTKLKRENKSGLEWLKEDVGSYLRKRLEFYKPFGDESEYYLGEEIIQKFESMK